MTNRSVVDLHTHSTASDGALEPGDLVRQAAAAGLRTIALTDHDTTEGVPEAVAAGSALGVEVIPGVEFGTTVAEGELHMLGYFIDIANEALQGALRTLREGRRDRAVRIVEQLRQAGVPIELEDVRRLAGEGSIGRAHVARVLVEQGVVGSVDEAFDRYLNRGKAGYVPRPRLTPVESVDAIRSAGGVAVLAHPHTVSGLDQVLPELVAHGLGGMEVFYAAYDDLQRAELAVLAADHRLVPTGGSDFHGIGNQEGRVLGSAPVPLGAVTSLRRRAR